MNRQIWNPYMPEYEYVPDGEPHVFGDRVYVYGSHDRFNGHRFCLNDYICYSADVKDLKNWKYEGVIYKKTQDIRTWSGEYELWAPDVVKGKDGRYYLYYCPDSRIRSIGVAVCDTPAGKYEFLGIVKDKEGRYIGEREGDTIQFDPGVFIDEDGTIYLYSGNGPRTAAEIGREPKASVVMTLEDDMVTIKTEPKKLLPILGEAEGSGYEGHEFFEASSIRKVSGKYYLVYSPCCLHELCYAVSDRPDGGFKFGGVIVSNCDLFPDSERNVPKNWYGNDHGGIECIDGQWYVFYHRQTNKHMFSRQACAEPITIDPEGRIVQAEMTSQGLNGKPLAGKGLYPAAMVCNLYGTDEPGIVGGLGNGKEYPHLTQDGPDYDVEQTLGSATEVAVKHEESTVKTPRQYIADGENGTVAVFRYFEMQEAVTGIAVTVRGTATGKLLVCEGDAGVKMGEILLSPAQEWKCFAGEVKIEPGVHQICFRYEGEGKFDLLEFELL